jgi:hypothetical protein
MGALEKDCQLSPMGLGYLSLTLYTDPKTQADLGSTAGRGSPSSSHSLSISKISTHFPNGCIPLSLTAFTREEVRGQPPPYC